MNQFLSLLSNRLNGFHLAMWKHKDCGGFQLLFSTRRSTCPDTVCAHTNSLPKLTQTHLLEAKYHFASVRKINFLPIGVQASVKVTERKGTRVVLFVASKTHMGRDTKLNENGGEGAILGPEG